jgi:hypothetical protein
VLTLIKELRNINWKILLFLSSVTALSAVKNSSNSVDMMGWYSIFCFAIISILVSATAFTQVANAFSISSITSKRLIRSQFSVLNDKKTKTEAKGFAPKKLKVVKVVGMYICTYTYIYVCI